MSVLRRPTLVRRMASALLVSVFCVTAGCGRGEGRGAPTSLSVPTPPEAPVVVVAPESPQSRQLRVAPVEFAEVPADEVVAPGRVIAHPNRIARVLLPVPGRVLEVLAGLGSTVERGQPVLALESPDADGAIAGYLQAEAGERQARAVLTKAQADVERARDLYGVRAIAEKELLSVQNDLAQAQGGAQVARAAREQAWRKLELLGLKPTDFRQRVMLAQGPGQTAETATPLWRCSPYHIG